MLYIYQHGKADEPRALKNKINLTFDILEVEITDRINEAIDTAYARGVLDEKLKHIDTTA